MSTSPGAGGVQARRPSVRTALLPPSQQQPAAASPESRSPSRYGSLDALPTTSTSPSGAVEGQDVRARHQSSARISPSGEVDQHDLDDEHEPAGQANQTGSRRGGRPASIVSVTTHRSVVYTKNNILDLRAAQRTFDGAYARTALGQLSYAVVILRLFQNEFYFVGIAYVVLAIGLLMLSVMRYKLTMESPEETHDDPEPEQPQQPHRSDGARPRSAAYPSFASSLTATFRRRHRRTSSSGIEHDYRTAPKINDVFRTAGDVVAIATAFTLVLLIALLVLVLRL